MISNKDNVVLRQDKAVPLTHQEGDQNFIELKNVIDDVVQVDNDLGTYVLANDQRVTNVETDLGTKVKVFGTVALMKAASLSSGDLVETKGYHSAGDGGQARYLIQTSAEFGDTPDEYGNHTLSNGNMAVLQVEGAVNVKQFGVVISAYDSIELSQSQSITNAERLQHAIDYCAANNIELIQPSGVIWVASYIIRKSHLRWRGIGHAVLKMHGSVHRNMPLCVSSTRDNPQFDIKVWDIEFNFNSSRWDSTAQSAAYTNVIEFSTEQRESVFGVASDALTQSCFIASDANYEKGQRSDYYNIRCIEGYKHSLDVCAPSYMRGSTPSLFGYPTGTAMVYDPQPARGIHIHAPYAIGGGDDTITTHHCDDIHFYDPVADIPSGVRTGNTNCIEIDDGSRNVHIHGRSLSRGGTCGLEIKGHSDSPAPFNIYVDHHTSVNCNIGFEPRHLGHHSSGTVSYTITDVNQADGIFTFSGDASDDIEESSVFTVSGSTGNNGKYFALSVEYDDSTDRTLVTIASDLSPEDLEDIGEPVLQTIPSSTANGAVTFTGIKLSPSARNININRLVVIAPRRLMGSDLPDGYKDRRNDARFAAKIKGYESIKIGSFEIYETFNEIDPSDYHGLTIQHLPTDFNTGTLVRGYLNARDFQVGVWKFRGFKNALYGAYFSGSFGRGGDWSALKINMLEAINGPREVLRATSNVKGVLLDSYDLRRDADTGVGLLAFRLSGNNTNKSLGSGFIEGYTGYNWGGTFWPIEGRRVEGKYEDIISEGEVVGRRGVRSVFGSQTGRSYIQHTFPSAVSDINQILYLCKAKEQGTVLRGELRGHRDLSTTTANTSGFRFDIEYIVSSNGTRRANWWLSRMQDNFRMRFVQFSLNGVDCIGLQSTSGVTGAPLRLSNLRFTGTKSDDPMFLQRVFLSDLDTKEFFSNVDYDVIADGQPLVRLYSEIITTAKDHKWTFNDRDVYHQGNILGTVSQSGGVPKGAIIERGSNANGEWVRYADGTQICWNSNYDGGQLANTPEGSVFVTGEQSYTFPVAFFGNPTVSVTSRGRRTWSGNCETVTANQISIYRQFAPAANTVILGVHIIAIGRWY